MSNNGLNAAETPYFLRLNFPGDGKLVYLLCDAGGIA